jgi:murein DD-endopeptidase MepM/ murein hydrolase activator NlpD
LLAPTRAIGPYSLPFFDHTVDVTQPYGCTGFPAEPPFGNCAHFHAGIDYGTAWKPIAAARAGQVVDMREDVADYTGSGCGSGQGNYVLIKHSATAFTLYYHLKKGSVLPAKFDQVNAGEKIGTSGNSGGSCGAHLHYALTVSSSWWVTDNARNPAGDWTTDDSGRVPWRAKYITEKYPAGYSSFVGSTVTVWVEFKNIGGQAWSATNPANGKGRVFLAAVNSSGTAFRDSLFYVSSDWESADTVGRADPASVDPLETGRFTWLMRTPGTGSFAERFSLRSGGLFWFDYDDAGGINEYYIPITGEHCC